MGNRMVVANQGIDHDHFRKCPSGPRDHRIFDFYSAAFDGARKYRFDNANCHTVAPGRNIMKS